MRRYRVQSMTKTDTRDAKATIAQIRELEDCGCEIIRVRRAGYGSRPGPQDD